MGVNVEFTGKGCRIVKTFEWVEFLTQILEIGGRINSFRCRLDDFNGVTRFQL